MDSINKAKLKSLTDSKVTEKSDYVKRAKSRGLSILESSAYFFFQFRRL